MFCTQGRLRVPGRYGVRGQVSPRSRAQPPHTSFVWQAAPSYGIKQRRGGSISVARETL